MPVHTQVRPQCTHQQTLFTSSAASCGIRPDAGMDCGWSRRLDKRAWEWQRSRCVCSLCNEDEEEVFEERVRESQNSVAVDYIRGLFCWASRPHFYSAKKKSLKEYDESQVIDHQKSWKMGAQFTLCFITLCVSHRVSLCHVHLFFFWFRLIFLRFSCKSAIEFFPFIYFSILCLWGHWKFLSPPLFQFLLFYFFFLFFSFSLRDSFISNVLFASSSSLADRNSQEMIPVIIYRQKREFRSLTGDGSCDQSMCAERY